MMRLHDAGGGGEVKVMFGIVSLVSGIELNNIIILPVKKLKFQVTFDA
jgi:hypothetical protein